MRPLKGTMVRMVVTGRPPRPGSQVGSKWRPSVERRMLGPGPRAGDQVLTNSSGSDVGVGWYTTMPRKPSSRGMGLPWLPMMVGALKTFSQLFSAGV
jgi:hypothetical protein